MVIVDNPSISQKRSLKKRGLNQGIDCTQLLNPTPETVDVRLENRHPARPPKSENVETSATLMAASIQVFRSPLPFVERAGRKAGMDFGKQGSTSTTFYPDLMHYDEQQHAPFDFKQKKALFSLLHRMLHLYLYMCVLQTYTHIRIHTCVAK